MGGNINFGSRTEFLPGEGNNEIDIKYQRYGGCFVSYKKGVLYLLASFIFAGIVGYLVFHYFSCNKNNDSVYDSADEILEDILKSANTQLQEEPKKSEKDKTFSLENINPLYYRLKIQPYLNENSDKKFSFEGQVTIVFQITGSPTKTIILNAKNLNILDSDVSLTYLNTVVYEPLQSASLLLEDEHYLAERLVAESLVKEDEDSNATTTTNSAIEETITITSPEDIINNDTLSSDDDTTISLFDTNSNDIDSKINDNHKDVSNETDTDASEFKLISSETESAAENTESPGKENDDEDSEPSPAEIATSTSTSASSSTTEKTVLKAADKYNIGIVKKLYNEKEGTYMIKTRFALEASKNYTLVMKFKGKIDDKLGGIIRTSYEQGNDTVWMISTILQPSYAKTVFPCFDDPRLKARFELSVARRTNMSVVSNMELKDTYEADNLKGWVWDHFEISQPMATYSIGFAVFGFKSIESLASVPIPLTKLWGRNEIINNATYILNIAPKIIESYNKFFGYNYSLHKIDLVAVPNLPVSAVGSWGLIFFRESEVAVSSELSSYEDKENLLELLSRELSKQWCGHVISIHSWIDSWLIETIASYSHYSAMNMVEPTWNLLDKVPILEAQEILDIDSLNILPKLSTISSNVDSMDNQQMLLYKKGGLIMRSLNISLTEPNFKKGIHNFVSNRKYKDFTSENFWSELTTASNNSLPDNIKIQEIMKKWETQEAYPLVTVTRNNENKTVTIKQTRFMDNHMINNKEHWILHLSYISSSSKDSKFEWLVNTSPKVIENAVDKQENSWIFFNLNRASLCRVNYDLNNWNSLISLLKSKPDTLSPANRAQLLDDAFHLARSGILNYTIALDMSLYLKEKEQHLVPWTVALKNMEFLDLVLSKTPNYGNFQDYLMQLFEPIYTIVKSNTNENREDPHSHAKLEKIILEWACKVNYKPCKDWALMQYRVWESISDDQTNPIQSDLRSIIYCVGVQNNGRKAWNLLWRRYTQQKNKPDEIKALIAGMACATEPWLIIKYLNRALEEENLHYSIMMWNALSSEITIESAFTFLKDNWNLITKKYEHSPIAMKQILTNILSQLTTQYDLDQIVSFYSKHKEDLQKFPQDIKTIIKKLKLIISWKANYLSDFNTWIEKHNV